MAKLLQAIREYARSALIGPARRRLLDEEYIPAYQDEWERLLSLKGIGKDFYARLGEAEKVIQEERAAFSDLRTLG